MAVIGLVGRVGAGKTTVARRFAELGAAVIDADRHAHEVLADPDVVEAIAGRFGADVLDAAGGVDRAALARAVFGDTPAHDAGLADLESLVHPRVRRRLEAEIAAMLREDRQSEGHRAVVLDVPLLVQVGWTGMCSHLVVVDCEESRRRSRLAARGWSPAEIDARDRAWSRGFHRPSPGPTTWAVDASGDPAYTSVQVDRIWRAIQGRKSPGA